MNGFGVLVESCWSPNLWSIEELYYMEQGVWSSHVGLNFALKLNQMPPSSSEIRPCMHNHLVELEAMQTVYSLLNGYTAPS